MPAERLDQSDSLLCVINTQRVFLACARPVLTAGLPKGLVL
jgi:hypothetical protein